VVFKLSPQNETLNSTSHAGHVISLSPGRLFILNLRSHAGHEISIFGLFGFKTKWVWQDEHCKFAGLLPTPQINTLEQEGQLIFSSLHFFLVPSCSTFTSVLHITQVMMPSPFGSKLLHFGHDRSGAEILDSTPALDSSSDMYSPPCICF
tara:strand:- start:433 stop:882 length:450 start_codon:yes stop_codon:yes gene_type:complete